MLTDKIQSIKNGVARNSLVVQFLRYLVTGGLAFLADYGLFALGLYIFKFHYLVSNLMGLVVGLLLNYAISVAWVFKDCNRSLGQKKTAEFLVFATVGFIGVGINQLLMFLLVGSLQINEMVSKIFASALVLMWNFFARKFILFRQKKI